LGSVTANDGIGAVVWAQVGDGESYIWAFLLPGRRLRSVSAGIVRLPSQQAC